MNRRFAGAVVMASAVALALSACSSSSKSSSSTSKGDSVLSTDGKGKTVTVWLQSDAQKGWPDVVEQANQRFEQATGAKVNVQWQQWSNYTTKLDSTFAGSSGIPDVVELGNTQTASYIAGGAFADLTKAKGQFENSASWLKGLADSGTSPDGKLEAVPYYAGSRVVIYRKDLFAKAGITTAPATLDELFSRPGQGQGRQRQRQGVLRLLHAGQVLVRGDVVRLRGRRQDRRPAGRQVDRRSWRAAQAQQGLTQWQKLTSYSVGGATKDESDQDAIMAQGHTGAILGNGWEVGSVTDPKTGKPALAPVLGTFPLPSATAGQYTPSFLGGSDLAVPAKAPNAGLGATWIKYFTDTASQTALAKFAIPNTTSLLSVYEAAGDANKSTGEAAKNTWFVPNTPNWANVESGNILQNMLESIATGKSSVADAAKSADSQIATTLNATS